MNATATKFGPIRAPTLAETAQPERVGFLRRRLTAKVLSVVQKGEISACGPVTIDP